MFYWFRVKSWKKIIELREEIDFKFLELLKYNVFTLIIVYAIYYILYL